MMIAITLAIARFRRGAAGVPADAGDNLLLESGDALLLENGDLLLLE
jgi:hypothetical protein